MSDIAIKIENLSKQYRLGNVGTGTLTHDLKSWWATARGKEDPNLQIGLENKLAEKGGDYVYALKDINLEIKKGDIVGVIGKNGAGKSTLLKILSRVTTPTTGSIDLYGRVASLLEVGTGFHPELTGRENIFLNGAIMGMSKQEIRSKFDEIVEFAGVGKYIDTPVKRYSSGMYIRLAFGVAAHLDPEILIVDEVLAVGDAEFQKKAIGKMQDVSRNEGRTVLFVSHNMGSISTLCNSGIILQNGTISLNGKIHDCVAHYISEGAKESTYLGYNITNDIYYKKITITNSSGTTTDCVAFNDTVNIRFELGFNNLIPYSTLSFTIYDSKLNPIFTSHHLLIKDHQTITAQIPKEFLLQGTYYLKPLLHIPNVRFLDDCDSLLSFRIEDTGSEHSFYNKPELGLINVLTEWSEK